MEFTRENYAVAKKRVTNALYTIRCQYVLDQYKSGRNMTEIGVELGVTRQRIYQMLRAAGYQPKRINRGKAGEPQSLNVVLVDKLSPS
jgi:DNA-binding phage protein